MYPSSVGGSVGQFPSLGAVNSAAQMCTYTVHAPGGPHRGLIPWSGIAESYSGSVGDLEDPPTCLPK